MADTALSPAERDAATDAIVAWFEAELGQELGRFDAGFLLDFFLKEIGPLYYNRALYDAQAILAKRLDSISEAILDLEKPGGLGPG
ncbi:DUF2164 domain-containing protein [Rhodobium gokarnense]|uniref:Uncharacterized protein (DUF2164 family) n=1 Tax=Rhodobium gokarnense TaxID=364296 RepID=A0ABT3H6N5_9HYPH|nr:DUF2164 domain-containing protein [Rhodobium gokarnense]MCW2306051.1 uncharacterized protein (DUF2164 family) [Rhodobium gokarnense]